MPLVSVIMPVFNGEKFVAEGIESVLAQTFTDYELLIVDDLSDDGSAEIVQAYAAKDERIRLLPLKRNLGMAEARNHAFVQARGEFIAAMDHDDVSLPRRLEAQVDFLRSHPEIGAIGARFREVTEDLRPIRDFLVPLEHGLIVLNMFIGGGFILHSTLMARRELFRAVGGYERGRRRHDDLELHSRLLPETGLRYANLPDILLLYRRHPRASSLSVNPMERAGRLAEIKRVMLERLWGEGTEATLDRFSQMHMGMKLNPLERRAAKRDLGRLIESLIEAGWVEGADRAAMRAEMNRRLEQTTPRLWQMFLHWRRNQFGRVSQKVKA